MAAGLGTRLKPITDAIPKCLVDICNKPLLGWWIDLLEIHNIDEVLINIHHFPDQVRRYVDNHNTTVKFNFFFEGTLLGSGGTLRENKGFVKGEREFFVFYADNLTNCDLTRFLNFHRTFHPPLSMALFRSENPRACGVAELDNNATIIHFEEKPKQPKSNLSNAGMYIASPEVLDMIPNYELTDIGFHVLPHLVGKMKGWITDGYLLDIGTIENLEKAERDWPEIVSRRN